MKKDKSIKNQYLTTQELADILKISRIAVFQKIKNKTIKAEKIGRNYVINKKDLEGIVFTGMSEKIKKDIKKSVARVVKEYGETLKLLGKE